MTVNAAMGMLTIACVLCLVQVSTGVEIRAGVGSVASSVFDENIGDDINFAKRSERHHMRSHRGMGVHLGRRHRDRHHIHHVHGVRSQLPHRLHHRAQSRGLGLAPELELAELAEVEHGRGYLHQSEKRARRGSSSGENRWNRHMQRMMGSSNRRVNRFMKDTTVPDHEMSLLQIEKPLTNSPHGLTAEGALQLCDPKVEAVSAVGTVKSNTIY